MPSCCIHNKSIGHKSFRSCGRKWTTAMVLCCHFAVQATKHRPFQQDRPCFLWFVILMACPFFRKLFCCTSFLFVPRKESKHDLQSLISKRQDPKSATGNHSDAIPRGAICGWGACACRSQHALQYWIYSGTFWKFPGVWGKVSQFQADHFLIIWN